MKPADGEPGLSPHLEAALEALTDRRLARRLRSVHLAAARAIEQLGNLNLLKHEPSTGEQGSADLSLWEEMAPAVRDTVVEVNALVEAIRGRFNPVDKAADLPSSSDARLELEVASVLDRAAVRLSGEMGGMAAKLRRPSVVSDRWNLLIELQDIRAGLREQIGNLVYLTAAACAPVERDQVVPGYPREIARAALVRSTAADLKRAVEVKLSKASAQSPARQARSIEGDLEAFQGMPAYRHIKASSKRELVELRDALRQSAENPQLTEEELRTLATPALSLLQALGAQAGESLTAHDRAILTSCGARLEQAQLHLELGSGGAPRVLAEALSAAEALYGRDPGFDGFLRKARGRSPALQPAGLSEELSQFRKQLASLRFQ